MGNMKGLTILGLYLSPISKLIIFW